MVREVDRNRELAAIERGIAKPRDPGLGGDLERHKVATRRGDNHLSVANGCHELSVRTRSGAAVHHVPVLHDGIPVSGYRGARGPG